MGFGRDAVGSHPAEQRCAPSLDTDLQRGQEPERINLTIGSAEAGSQ
jgi:hypothetical protein